jgi:ribosome-interacting GTPase 1
MKFSYGFSTKERRIERSEMLIRRDLLDQMTEQAKIVKAAADDLVRATARVIADRNAGRGFVVTDIQSATEALSRVTKELEDMAAAAAKEDGEKDVQN